MDAQTIDDCLQAAAGKGASGVTCIGIVADPCIVAVREQNDATAAALICATREGAVWTSRLRVAVQSASKAGGKATASAVAASQQSWQESIKALCPRFNNLDPGMSLGGGGYCVLQETAMRALVLERLADAVNPH